MKPTALEGVQAAADGGETAEAETPVPADAEEVQADARCLAKWVDDMKKELSKWKTVAIATLDDTDPAWTESVAKLP